MTRQRLAVIGSGISGLVSAYLLSRDHDVTVFEAAPYAGGHTNTLDVPWGDRSYAVDTGFIVFNDWTYPNFIKLLEHLRVPYHASDMSFSVRRERGDFEYNGTSLNTLFGQRRNLLRPSFYRMIRDILRFNREAPAALDTLPESCSLWEFLQEGDYSEGFLRDYILPMGAAIWSSEPEDMKRFPARFFIQFFKNHGMLSVDDRPTWQVVKGGSRSYVQRILGALGGPVRLGTPIEAVERRPDEVRITPRGGATESFDGVILATHSDQALRLLADPTGAEREILGALPYQRNVAILHTDTSLMPRRRRCWAAWNYHVPATARDTVQVTYNMNILQGLDAPVQFLVTLNHGEAIQEEKVLRRIEYTHPVFTVEGIAAQKRHAEISGANRTWFCGAYWRNGFHEDGVWSALQVTRDFGIGIDDLDSFTTDRLLPDEPCTAASTAAG